MKNFLIYAVNFDEQRIIEDIKTIFHGRNFIFSQNGENINISYKQIFGTENFTIKITDKSNPSYMSMKDSAKMLFSRWKNSDAYAAEVAMDIVDKTEAFVGIKCEKDYSGLLDELFVRLTLSVNGAALTDNGVLIDSDGMVILCEDGTAGDSALLESNITGNLSLHEPFGAPILPKIDLPQGFSFPTKDDIIGRACAYLIISGYASDVTMAVAIKESRTFYEELIEKYEIEEYLSEDELSLLYKDNPSIDECFEQLHDFDKAAVLMWFLSLTDMQILTPYGDCVNYHSIMQILASYQDFDDLYDNSKIRSSGELLNLADKLYSSYTEASDNERKSIESKYAGILWLCTPPT